MRATSSAFSASSSKPGDEAAARSTKSETDSYSSSCSSGSARSGLGMSSDGTRKTTSPATRSGSRLVATIVSSGANRSSRSESAAVAARTCSQLSSTRSSVRAGQSVDHRVDEVMRGQGANVERGCDCLGDQLERRRGRRARRAQRRLRTTARRCGRARARVASSPLLRSRTASGGVCGAAATSALPAPVHGR